VIVMSSQLSLEKLSQDFYEKYSAWEKQIEKWMAVAGILQSQVKEIVELQHQALNLFGDVRKHKVASGTATGDGNILALAPSAGQFLHLVTVFISNSGSAGNTATLQVLDKSNNWRTFATVYCAAQDSVTLHFGGLKLDEVRIGATWSGSTCYGVKVGDGSTDTFKIVADVGAGTEKLSATIIYYESPAVTR